VLHTAGMCWVQQHIALMMQKHSIW
jgi:hypothetical protein